MEITQLSLIILCLGIHESTSGNSLRQKRNWIIDSLTIEEDYDGPYPYSLGTIEVEKNITLFKIKGQGVDQEPRNVLKINERTGEILVFGPVDYERYQELRLTFQAIDRERNIVDTQLGIYLQIVDANDFAPQFAHEKYEINIKESTSQGSDLITIKATDKDISPQFNGIEMRIVSVSPTSEDLEFYLIQAYPNEVGTISFKGCLDYEKAKEYNIIVEAKDHGEPKQLSSSSTVVMHIEDQNNHLPVFTDKTSKVKVREDQKDILILRLPVTDKDTTNTPSWRARFNIQEDTKKNFRITTDKNTNEGLLHVDKFLDYEESPMNNITITVENEVPYYQCKVLEQSKAGLWRVASTAAKDGSVTEPVLSSQRVTVIVEDANEAPIFGISNQHVHVMENVPVGKYLRTFTAEDPDIRSANTIVYKIGKDPANWVTVDSKSGEVTTIKILDRESPFVNNSNYLTTILAVDDGKPPMTGTATLTILIGDDNDHAPHLATNVIDICQSDKPSMAPIFAADHDEVPNAGPFRFKLLGDVKDKWSVDPSHGHSVNLVKENTVHSGPYELLVEISDLQGQVAVQNLSVTVCNCLDPTQPNCRIRKSAASSAGGAAVGIIFLSLLLLAGLLLLAALLSCKNEKIAMTDDGSGHLMISNTEKPGTDCQVSFDSNSKKKLIQKTSEIKTAAAKPIITNAVQSTETHVNQEKNQQWMSMQNEASTEYTQFTRRERPNFVRGNSLRMSTGASSAKGRRLQRRASSYGEWPEHLKIQETMLNKTLFILQTPDRELGDYQPRVYAEEGDSTHSLRLDAMTVSDVCFDPNMELDWKFSNLASVCIPTQTGVYSRDA